MKDMRHVKTILVALTLLSNQSVAIRVNDDVLAEADSVSLSHSVADSSAISYEDLDLSSEQKVLVHKGLELLDKLKEDSDNEQLQAEYHNLIGNVEWASPNEETALSNLDEESVREEVQPLGSMSVPGEEYTLVELLGGLATKFGRVFTHRRDFAVEPKDGATKYVIDGKLMSLHSRMHIFDQNGKPLYVLRRSFNYLNPIARIFGQYSYRVLECRATDENECAEGITLYTITKDRLGRGLLWGRDEWRVFTGLGGCKRHDYGVVSCNSTQQILYSISSGLFEDGAWATTYYQGDIKTMDTTYDGTFTAYMYSGSKADAAQLKENNEVAKSNQVGGPPRMLNWPIVYTLAEGALGATGSGLGYLFKSLFSLAKNLVWSDSYSLKFTKATDELLIIAMQAVQDLTQDVRAEQMLPAGAQQAK